MDNATMFLRLDPKKIPPKPQNPKPKIIIIIIIIIISPIELDLYAKPTIFYDI
jgi:hypothetical protein